MAGIDKYLHAVLVRAADEAAQDGSARIEARHLLIAMAVVREDTVQRLLESVGLDEQGVRDALAWEFEHSLSVVGVSSRTYDLPKPTRFAPRNSMGTSAKLAIERSFMSVPRKRDARPAHVLLGVLSAEVGTVPRALEMAGIDRDDLMSRARAALTGDS